MLVERVEVEISWGFTQNCFIVSDAADSTHVALVDPGAQFELIRDRLGGRIPDTIILTHHHYDHIGAVNDLVRETGARVIAHAVEAQALQNPSGIISASGLRVQNPIKVDQLVEEGDVLIVGNQQLTVMHTPGHTAGSICLFDEQDHVLFSGDTLFFEAVGRTDFPGGNASSQLQSIKRLFLLPDNAVVYPGHNKNTTIGHEKSCGPMSFVAS